MIYQVHHVNANPLGVVQNTLITMSLLASQPVYHQGNGFIKGGHGLLDGLWSQVAASL